MNPVVESITQRVRARSRARRQAYLARTLQTAHQHPPRRALSCGNLAHGFAACGDTDKRLVRLMQSANLGIVTAYNDMLSAHQPLQAYPDIIKQAARELDCSAQVAGGVPAMCDGVTQGQPGMELSLFSRDVIAMATAISLSHNLFDGVICLGVCDKIVPGMLIGALQFGHLPAVFIPGGPMPSGIPNKEKAAVRQLHAEGRAGEAELLAAEAASYHAPGTCTFYGTANTNQVMVELLGVQLPGSSFVNPGTPLRTALIRESVARVIAATAFGGTARALCDMVTEASLVNAVVGLLATGGSTNHTLHLVAIAAAAGIELHWEDIAALSHVVPLLARIYPNGDADVNDFQRAGGMAFLVRELRGAGLLNEDVVTLMGEGLAAAELAPRLVDDRVVWTDRVLESGVSAILRGVEAPFDPEGGLRLLAGNLGRSVIKTSAIPKANWQIRAPCQIFDDQDQLKQAFDTGQLDRDVIVVVRFQGPRANGMPELHKLTPYLGVLQDRGQRVALLTDGRMSGASGKVPAAIHLAPEAVAGGPIARLRDGDMIALDAHAGTLDVEVDAAEFAARSPATGPGAASGLGRDLFESLRPLCSSADRGASLL